MSAPYLTISPGYSYVPLRVGLVLRNDVTGHEVYFQPGEHTAAIRDTIEALGEASESLAPAKFAIIADIALGDYF